MRCIVVPALRLPPSMRRSWSRPSAPSPGLPPSRPSTACSRADCSVSSFSGYPLSQNRAAYSSMQLKYSPHLIASDKESGGIEYDVDVVLCLENEQRVTDGPITLHLPSRLPEGTLHVHWRAARQTMADSHEMRA